MSLYCLLIIALLASAQNVLGQTTSPPDVVTVVTEQKTTEKVTTAERTTERFSTDQMIPGVVPEITVIREENRRWMFTELARFTNCGIGNGMEAAGTFIAGSLANCGQKCLALEGCLSFEFDTINKTCNIYNVSALENLEEKEGYTYADGVLPQVGPVHPCDDLDICVGRDGNNCTEMCHPGGFKCHCPPGLMGDNCDVDKPVDGIWTSWLTWSNCSSTCRKTTHRSCTDPPPGAGGKACEGINTKTSSCSPNVCNVFPYIGCLNMDESSRSGWGNDTYSYVLNEMTIEICLEHCRIRNSNYAALQNGDTCYCIQDQLDPRDIDSDFDESLCSSTCGGGSGSCGGDSGHSYYAIKTPYVGCYSFPSDSIPSDLYLAASGPTEEVSLVTQAEILTNVVNSGTEVPQEQTSMATSAAPVSDELGEVVTIDSCILLCASRGFSMALLGKGNRCYCTNSLPIELTYNPGGALCNKTCDSEDGFFCGGEAAFSVFFTYDKLNDGGYKTGWFNQDDPSSDEKDEENPLSSAQWSYCQSPSSIECITTGGVSYTETNETEGFQEACTLSNGIVCDNADLGFDVSIQVNVDTGESSFNVQNTDREVVECLFDLESGDPGEFITSTLVCSGQTKEVQFQMTENSTDSAPADQTVDVSFSITCSDYQVRYTCDEREVNAYIGCYEDSGFDGTPSSLTADGSKSYRELCIDYCAKNGYRFGGLKSENCACTNILPPEGPKDYTECNFECLDTQKTPCGSSLTRSIFMTECKKHFSGTMKGTDLYKDDGTWLSGGWYHSLDGSATVPLVNYTNTDLDLQLKITFGSVKTVSGVVTEGLNWASRNEMTGVKTFYIGYRNSDQSNSASLIIDETDDTAPKVFTISSISTQQEHSLGRYILADEIYIYVKTFEKFPGLKIDVIGCAD